MGRDKALLPVAGRAMAVRVADALRAAGADPVRAVGGDAPRLRALGMEVVPDERPGEGPLPAVITALRGATWEVVLVVACDLLDPDPEAMAATAAALAADPEAHVAVPVDAGGIRQWAHAAWRRSAVDRLDAAVATGARSLVRAAGHLTVVEVANLPAEALRDADGPGDLPPPG